MKKNNSLPPTISVIIPIFNDTERLIACLNKLQDQTLSSSKFIIIIIDNGKNETLVSRLSHFNNITIDYESTPGSYNARNKAISLLESEYIAFTDSDCMPEPNWLENGLKKLQENKNLGLVGGNITLFYKNENQLSLAEVFEKHTAFQQQRYIEQYQFAATANMFTRKSVFEKVGLFNEELRSSGDKEWGERVYKAGYKLAYAENCIVQHPARHSLKMLYGKQARLIGGVETRRKNKEIMHFFDKDLLTGIIPSFREVRRIIYFNSSFYEKIIALSVLLSLSIYSTFVRLRLRLGGKASR